MDEIILACEKADREPPPSRYGGPEDGVTDRIREICVQRRAAAAEVEQLDLPPDAWLYRAMSIRYRLRRFLSPDPATHDWPLNYMWAGWLEWLESLDRQHSYLEPDGWCERPGTPAPTGLLEGLSKAGFCGLTADPMNFPGYPAEPIEPDAVERIYDSYLHMEDGSALSSIVAWEDGVGCMRVGSQLELLTGAWVPSRGAGPFAPIPAGAVCLVDPTWDVLPLFRIAWRDGLREHGREWFVVEPSAIGEAMNAIPEDPIRVDVDHAPSFNAGKAGWLDWQSAAERWWPRCRARYLHLLEEAAVNGDAVIYRYWLPDDQGTGATPLEAELGEPVRLPAP